MTRARSGPGAGAALVLLLVAAPAAAGQDGSSGPAREEFALLPPLTFDRLGREEGGPLTATRVILQDRTGFMWFATDNGLARHDGFRTVIYRPSDADTHSVSSAYISALALCPDGRLAPP